MKKFTGEEGNLLAQILNEINQSDTTLRTAGRKLFTVTAMSENFRPLIVDEFVRLDTERLRAELVSEYALRLKSPSRMSYLEERHLALNSASFISKHKNHTYIYLKDTETIFSIRVESVYTRLEKLEEEYIKEREHILSLEQDSLSE